MAKKYNGLDPDWKSGVILLGVSLFVIAMLYFDTLASIVSIWVRSETFAHGFLIVPISLYLIWRQREKLMEISPRPYPFALVPLIVLIFLWLLADLAEIQLIKQLALVSIVPVTVLLILGRKTAQQLLFPLGYLIFAVPMGEFLIPVLQDFTAAFTVQALHTVGIPVFWEGRHFITPTATFEVAEACSGIRYLIASFTLGVLYAYINYRSFRRRAIFITLSIVVPIIANGLRAFGIVLIVYFSNNRIGKGVDHIIYGWIFFGVVMLLLFYLGARFIDKDRKDVGNVSDVRNVKENVYSVKKGLLWLATSIILAASGPLAASVLKQNIVPPNAKIRIPEASQPWVGPGKAELDWRPQYAGASFETAATYKMNGKVVQLYIVRYTQQSQGLEMITSQNRLYDRNYWKQITDHRQTITLKSNEILSLNEMVIEGRRSTLLLWQWYEINGVFTSQPLTMKLYESLAKLKRVASVPTSIIIATPFYVDETEAKSLLQSFLNTMYADVKKSLNIL